MDFKQHSAKCYESNGFIQIKAVKANPDEQFITILPDANTQRISEVQVPIAALADLLPECLSAQLFSSLNLKILWFRSLNVCCFQL